MAVDHEPQSVILVGEVSLPFALEGVEVIPCQSIDEVAAAREGRPWPLIVADSATASVMGEVDESLVIVACQRPEESLEVGRHLALPLWDAPAASLAWRSVLNVGRRLRELYEDAAERRREHEDFVHAVSHDLKGPLQGIMGLAGLLMEQSGVRVFPEVGAYASRIEGEADRLAAMVSALTAYTRLGHVEARSERVSLSRLTDELSAKAIREHTERFPRFQVAPDLPDVIADESLLRTAIAALIDNAVAFTDSQPLVIQVEHHPSSSGTCALVVADSGIGIPASALEGVFELFTRLDKRRGEGVGVGLTMAKRAVERCGGTLTLESELGVGTRATITLNRAP